jgi:chemotaxis protein histidine kinase CheA
MEGIAAATILGNGTVALILDAGSLVRRAHASLGAITVSGPSSASSGAPAATFH